MQSLFSDKEILGDALASEKSATDHYNTFANECVHEGVRNAMLHCLSEEHNIQQDVFEMMHSRGFYPTPAAQESKVKEAKQTYSQTAKL
ncbi:MAG: spore coat protein [Hespellia sp.]|nr:spore coat protein [Hespellia sp.]